VEDFSGKIAVVTGGGSGIGRELVRQLSATGCHVACCDLDEDGLEETRKLSLADAPTGTNISLHLCDVANEDAVNTFAAEARVAHNTEHFNLLINNAGIAGGGSFINNERKEWDKTFGVCWTGVYNGCRAFLPLLIKSSEGHVVNISSVNGFWACMSPQFPHTAYSAAKFAVKGFSEALMIDLQLHAPHVGLSVVMPGHIGTSIAINARKVHDTTAPEDMSSEELAEVRTLWARFDEATGQLDDETVRTMLIMQGENFRDNAPTTAAQAATIILDGVHAKQWRILVGDDAVGMDAMVRAEPENAYTLDFFERLQAKGIFDRTSL
jgi:NAD(P)-dependent dehydrogenase (short-subunit alcohol dehydrogenase family)